MKKLIFPLFAAIALLASSAAAAQNRPEGRNDNYGYDKAHQVTPEERARWEATHRDAQQGGHRADRKDNRKNGSVENRKDERTEDRRDERKAAPDDRTQVRKADRRDDRNGKEFNYGFDKTHKVTPQERARWEETHKGNNGR